MNTITTAALALAGTLLLPAAAHAQTSAASHPPAKSVAGVKVTWPSLSQAIAYAPGTPLTVKVSSSHRRTRLSLVRVNAAGKVLGKAVARRTLRSGTFKTTVPSGYGIYQLRATIAGRRYWSWVHIFHPLGSPGVASPACPTAVTAAIALGATSVGQGDELPYSLMNTSPANCGYIETGAAYGLQQRQGDGSWMDVPLHLIVPLWAMQIGPGGSLPKRATIPADAAPGTYRVLDGGVTSDPFQVVASTRCDAPPVLRIDLDPSTVMRGARFTYSLVSPQLTHETAEWQVKDGSDWVSFPAGTVSLIGQHTAELPAGAPAGTYRLHENVDPAADQNGCDFLARDVYGPEITLP